MSNGQKRKAQGPRDLVAATILGNREEFLRIYPLVHGEVERLANKYLRRECSPETFDPASLVNEAYLRIERSGVSFRDEHHIRAILALQMRRVLVERARRRRLIVMVPFPSGSHTGEPRSIDILDLNAALKELRLRQDPRLAQIVDLRFFSGLTNAEAGRVLGVGERMALRIWRAAKEFLLKRVEGKACADGV